MMCMGGPNLGLYAIAGNEYLLVPSGFASNKAEILARKLGVPWHAVSLCGTRLLGVMSVHANGTALLPKTVHESEYRAMCDVAESVHVLDTKYTALGNMVCANNRGAIISPMFDEAERSTIQDMLGVETVSVGIAGLEQTGALAATNKGGTVVHPMAEHEEMDYISGILGTRVEPSTINGGVPYVASGILLNDTSIVVGGASTGPEIMMLTRAFLG